MMKQQLVETAPEDARSLVRRVTSFFIHMLLHLSGAFFVTADASDTAVMVVLSRIFGSLKKHLIIACYSSFSTERK